MSFWNSKKVKKTRKVHKCQFCGRKIPIGSSCNNESGMYEGEFQNYYLCSRCEVAISEWDVDLSDGFSCGDFYEYAHARSLADCPACGKRHGEHEWSEDTMFCHYECGDCDNEWMADFSLGTTDC